MLKVRRYKDLIKWDRHWDEMEKKCDELNGKIFEAEEEKREAMMVASEHPELWERQTAKAAKLESIIKKLEKQLEGSIVNNTEAMNAALKYMVPDQAVETARCVSTANDFWCGEYKRNEYKTHSLIRNLCDINYII